MEKIAKSYHSDFNGVDLVKNDRDLYGVTYSLSVVPLVKAVQELTDMNDEKDIKVEWLMANK